jgi:hypothetical protein
MSRFCTVLFALCVAAPALASDGSFSMEQAIGEDITDLLSSATTAALSTGGLTCTPTFGDCNLCTEVDGNAVRGTFEVYTTSALDGSTLSSCGGEVVAGARSVSYTVGSTALDGVWKGNPLTGDYDFEFGGSRRAAVSVTSVRNGTHTYNASSDGYAEVSLVGGGISSFVAELAYTSFGGHVYQVEVSGDADSFEGTAQRDDGVACTVTGTIVDGAVTDLDLVCL